MNERRIHWTGTPRGVCPKKDSGEDQLQLAPAVRDLAEASHFANVTCWRCKKAHNQMYSKKGKEKK